MPNILPFALVGGAFLLLGSGGSKQKRKKTSSSGGEPTPLPGVDEDLDAGGGGDSSDPTPTPVPVPTLPPSSEESKFKPENGPSGSSSCSNEIYSREAHYLDPAIANAAGGESLHLFNEQGYYFYIRQKAQVEIFNYMLNRFRAMKDKQEAPTVMSVILRDALKHFNSQCAWEGPITNLDEQAQLVWEGASRLGVMAQETIGMDPPETSELFQTGERFSITRKSLGDPDPGFINAPEKSSLPGRRVEILVTDKSQENAEHIIGEVIRLSGPSGEPNLFEVRIVGSFQGHDVKPRLTNKHGFKVGSNAFFSQQGPTGIYRIYPEGKI